MLTKLISQQPVTVSPFPFAAANMKLFQAAARLQANGLKAAMRYQIEALSFLKRRLEADAKLMDDLSDSKEFEDAVDVVGNFVQNASMDYASEVSNIASIGSRLASETAKYAREEAREVAEDIAAATAA